MLVMNTLTLTKQFNIMIFQIHNQSTTNPITNTQLNSFIFNLKKQLKPLKLKIYTNQPQPSQFLLQNSNNTKYQNPFILIPISHFKSNQPSSILQFYLTPTKSNIKFNQKQIHSIYNLIF